MTPIECRGGVKKTSVNIQWGGGGDHKTKGLDDKTRIFNLISYWARITNYVRKKKVTCYFASLTAVTLTATPPPSPQNPPNVNVLHHVSLALLLKYT